MTIKEDVPPIGRLEGVHLLTEGILTLSKTMEYIQRANVNMPGFPPILMVRPC